MAAQVTVRPRKTCWDYSMQNMSLIVAVKSNALNDCKAALDDNAILEWLTPGYYRILGENDDDEDSPIMNKEDLEEASLDFPGYESNYQASNGNTALHIAAREGKIEIAKLLLKHGWSLTKRNGRNETPIETAEIFYKDRTADWLRSYQRRTRLARVIFKIAVRLRVALKKVREKNKRKRRRKNHKLKRVKSVKINPMAIMSEGGDIIDGANTTKHNDKQQLKNRHDIRSSSSSSRGSFLSPPTFNSNASSLEDLNASHSDKLLEKSGSIPPPTARRRSTRLNKRKRA